MNQDMQARDQEFMRAAMVEAERAASLGEIPVGAVLVHNDEIIARGCNQSISLNDPSAHAEMQAMRAAGDILNNYRMLDCTLYVTLEPCPMCAGLLVHSRISRLVYGASDLKTGACGSVFNLVQSGQLNHQVEITAGVLQEECSANLSAFFKKRRDEKKQAKRAQRKAP
ncbi:tRNA adenosine(34) deaminase TadA [Thalassotalea mangrovi]|uniref:tRNA-specific adenosine deaminase n=1 Tax=Thalassotalea mangrovi TaxID=2572245 RepID=A0A4U1B8T6_9GAMM|nr:tRNA adenosine(34) deaminase TadA [Thalassotalea mangrovi]TKB47116.1 tRNA adenosine(34) deaminase TadA [Thalassotalea mangrovi]